MCVASLEGGGGGTICVCLIWQMLEAQRRRSYMFGVFGVAGVCSKLGEGGLHICVKYGKHEGEELRVCVWCVSVRCM